MAITIFSRGLCLASILRWAVMFLFAKRRGRGFWLYLYDRVAGTVAEGKRTCILRWLFAMALTARDPERIIKVYRDARATSLKSAAPRVLKAVFESAVWLREKDVADSLLADISRLGSSTRRLLLLYTWRFERDRDKVKELLSPIGQDEPFLGFLDYFARATVAESLGKTSDALTFYRFSLKTLPKESEEYRRAVDSCNHLLNISNNSD